MILNQGAILGNPTSQSTSYHVEFHEEAELRLWSAAKIHEMI